MDFALCLLAYAAMIFVIFWKRKKKGPSDKPSDDDDGGISLSTDPELDLPPGVCLPVDGPRKREVEEVLV